MPEKKTSFSFVPLATAAVVLTGAAAGAYLYFKGTFTKFGPLDSAKVVPDEALVAAYINTDPGAWSKLQQFGTAEAQAAIAGGLEDFQPNFLDEENIDYDQDLKPWVDGVMLAVLPPSVTEAETREQEPSLLMVVGIKDKIAALNFARKLESREDVATEEISYKGVKMTKIGGEESDPTYIAVLDDYLAIAFNQGMLENAIDTVKGEPSLASKPGAAKSISSSSGKVQNPIAHIYMPDYASAMQQFLELVPDAGELPDEIKYVKNGALVIGVDDAGVRVKASAEVDPAGFPNPGKPGKNKFTSRFPADTLALVGGRGLARAWSALVAGAPSQPELQEFVDELRSSLKDEADLDVDREVFGWMDGEFAAGVFLPPQGEQGFPGGAMIFETSDRSTAEATLKKLEAYVKKSLPINLDVAQNKIEGVEVTEWKIQNEAIGGYGWLDGNSVFLVLGGSFLDVIAIPAADPLDSSPNYQAIAGSLPQSNYSYFYLDVEKVMILAGPALLAGGAQFPPESQAILYSIQGIGVTATAPNSSTTEMEMLFALKKTGS